MMKPPKSKIKLEYNLRQNYSDHSQKFHDWVESLGFERTWFGRWVVFLEETLQMRRLSLLLLFCLLLAFTIHWEIRGLDHFRVGEVATSDLISPLSFEVIDEVTTEEKRSKAESQVPVVLDFDPFVFERVSDRVFTSFRALRQKVKAEVWPKQANLREEKVKEFIEHKGEFEKLIGVQVPDRVFEWLVENQFSVRLENALIRNLEKWYRSRISQDLSRVLPSDIRTVSIRTVSQNSRGREQEIGRERLKEVTDLDHFQILDTKGLNAKDDKEVHYIQTLAQSLLQPNATVNVQEHATRRQQARDAVLPVTISIKKNQTIIQEGSVVQPAMMALIKEIESLRSDRRHDLMLIASGFFLFFMLVIFLQYMRRFNARIRLDSKDLLVLGIITLGMVIFLKVFWFTIEHALVSKFGSSYPASMSLFLAPLAAAPMMAGLLIISGEMIWIYCAFMGGVVGFLTEMNLVMMLLTFVGGIAAARGVYICKKRNDIYWAGVRTGVVNAILIGLVLTLTRLDQVGFSREILFAVPAGFLSGILSSMMAMTFIPLLESIFNYTTDVKLLELSNLNHPLLKEMIVKAPGTYHHSLMVGSMVEAAAEEIGANPLLAKVMAYYHDIGKMEHANYFIENQRPGANPHDQISPFLSKTLLIAHVKDGVELGMKYKLGKPIIDGILQHHGTTLISFFHNKALDMKAEGDGEILEDDFRYPGPKPQFREAALCMLADSIEAAARSLDEPTPSRLQNIVRNIIQRKFMDAQLDECNITLKDLSKVERAFNRILLGIYHQRIDYPRSAGGAAHEDPEKAAGH